MKQLRGWSGRVRPGILLIGAGAGLAVLLAGASMLPGCARGSVDCSGDEQTGPSWFIDVIDEVGLDFVLYDGQVVKYFMPQISGTVAALFDFYCVGQFHI